MSTPALAGSGAYRTYRVRPYRSKLTLVPDHPLRTTSALAAIAAVLLVLGALGAQQPSSPVDGEQLATAGAAAASASTPGGAVKAAHLTELRARVNATRGRCGLGTATWTDANITPGATLVKAVHFNELRNAIEEAYRSCDLTPPSWSNPITAGVTPIRAQHVSELREAATLPRARYRVTFVSDWSASTHPQDYPDNAHYSPLIGSTHRAGAAFWMPGGLASPGVENMAETGSVSPLDTEIRNAVTAGSAGRLLRGGQLNQSPGRLTMEFDVTLAFPHVSLVTMIAPSPDWFLGVYDFPLVAADGQWLETVERQLIPWDAGTDSGRSYESPDADTVPQERILILQGFPVSTAGAPRPFGRFVFNRIG